MTHPRCLRNEAVSQCACPDQPNSSAEHDARDNRFADGIMARIEVKTELLQRASARLEPLPYVLYIHSIWAHTDVSACRLAVHESVDVGSARRCSSRDTSILSHE